MVVDSSSTARPIREINEKAVPTEAPKKKRGLFDAVLKNIAASDDASASSSDNNCPDDADVPVPGVQAQAGSLAYALGMVVDPSSRAPPIRDTNQKAAIQKRGLFDAVLKNIAPSDDESASPSDNN